MSNSLPNAKPGENGVTDRLRDQKMLWGRIFESAREHNVEAIFVQGDLFDHPRVDPITLRETIASMEDPPVHIFFIGGNHDGVNTRGERFLVEALDSFGDFHYMKTGVAFEPRPWLSFWPLEFAPMDRTREALKAMDLDTDDVNVLLMHNSVIGCTHVGWTCDDGMEPDDVFLKAFDHVLSGHFHDPQEFGDQGRYLGAPMHHHFGDVGRQAGFWIMEFHEDGTRDETFIDGDAPRFHTMDWDEEARSDFLSSWRIEEECANPGDFIRIKVTSTHAELTKLKPAVEEFVADMRHEGMRARWVHDPVYHHTRRIVADDDLDGSASISATSMVGAYVEAAEVDTTGLDMKKLRSVGRGILREVEGSWQD